MSVEKNCNLEEQDGRLTLSLMREGSLNSLSTSLLREISSICDEINIRCESGKLPRALVIRGEGGKAFTSGADLEEMKDGSSAELRRFAELGQSVFRKIELLPIPVMAVVDGYALGGGFELALSTDVIIASEKSVFGFPEVSLGLIPGFGGSVRLARRIGIPRAKAMIISGIKFTAREAWQLGLIDVVVEDDECEDQLQNTVDDICSKGPIAQCKVKEICDDHWLNEASGRERKEAAAFELLAQTEDMREGICAFFEKRMPSFIGK